MKTQIKKVKNYWKRASSDMKSIAARSATVFAQVSFKTHLKITGYFFLTLFVVLLAIPLFLLLVVIKPFGDFYSKILNKILEKFKEARKPIEEADQRIGWE